MAKKTGTNTSISEPKFPYTPSPNSLRKLLKQMPDKPKPQRMTCELLKGWGFTSSNDRCIPGILKKLNFLDSSGVPNQNYESFMLGGSGPATMGAQIRRVYAPLFQASHRPHEENDLKRLFHIHSGGSESVVNYQIQTFKALCEFASFESLSSDSQTTTDGQVTAGGAHPTTGRGSAGDSGPFIHIDLHIHLPENKTTREYEGIIQDIARYIYMREVGVNGH